MRRVSDTREGRAGLLSRRPWVDLSFTPRRAPVPDVADQLRELVDLYDRGLLSAEELDRQRAKLSPPP